MENMREEFESWCSKEIEIPDGWELNWENDQIKLMWRGWQASRDFLVIELPDEKNPDRYDSDQYWKRSEGYNDALEECRSAIEKVGLKVKP